MHQFSDRTAAETRQAPDNVSKASPATRLHRRRARQVALLAICGFLAIAGTGWATASYADNAVPPSCGPDGVCNDPPPVGNVDATIDNAPVVDDPGPPVDPTADMTSAPDVVISADGTKAVAAAATGPRSVRPKARRAGPEAAREELPYTGLPLRATAALGMLLLLAGCVLQVVPAIHRRLSAPPAAS